MAKVAEQQKQNVAIKAPNFQLVRLRIDGTAPLMISKFAKKGFEMMKAKHEAGSTAKGKKERAARDFEADCNGARHISVDGWDGVHAGAFRSAMISACRTVGFKMTLAKLAVWVVADGFDAEDGVPLVRIHGDHALDIRHTRNATGVVDLRARPRYDNWHAFLTVQYDADIFTLQDVVNLLMRVGAQVGIGEGRPDSRASAGIGFGTFSISTEGNATTWSGRLGGVR
jgi:hypothetical protein